MSNSLIVMSRITGINFNTTPAMYSKEEMTQQGEVEKPDNPRGNNKSQV